MEVFVKQFYIWSKPLWLLSLFIEKWNHNVQHEAEAKDVCLFRFFLDFITDYTQLNRACSDKNPEENLATIIGHHEKQNIGF